MQGKKLDQLYPKSNEFHTSRRSWYLPISPSPDHPDANSKKAKKRFPTLALADGAALRWDSYVNIRHIYKIDRTLLKLYANLNTPKTSLFRLERESTVRMVAKGKILTLYEPGVQVLLPGMHKARTAPFRLSTDSASDTERVLPELEQSDSDTESVVSPAAPRTPSAYGSNFRAISGDGDRSTKPSPGEPPLAKAKQSFLVRLRKRLFRRGRKNLRVAD